MLAVDGRTRIRRLVGVLFFIAGFCLGLLFDALAVWGDLETTGFWGMFEAATYDPVQEIDARLGHLDCPVLITSGETGVVTAAVTNPHERSIQAILQSDISSPSGEDGIRQDRREISLAPGERQEIAWQVYPDDRRYGRIIMTRVYLYQELSAGPARTAHCGVLVIDLFGLGGSQIVALGIAASLLGMAAGGWLWFRANRPLKGRTPQVAFGLAWLLGVTFLGMAANLLNLFLLAGGLLVLAVISLVSMLEIVLLPR
jgi:hypothetical protein